MKNKFFTLVFVCLTFLILPVFSNEAIHSFDSLIQVQTDGTMIVTETLRVHHEGINIRRGIYRDLPTERGEKYKLISVTRNGQHEPSFVEKRSGYYRINTGDDSLLPNPATSTFEIKYKVWNIPKSYDGYDEVYWNVTGDKWTFPIDSVSAKVELPYDADIIQQASYIGHKGSQESATYEGNGQYSGRSLSPGEQLTVAIGFTPGIVSTEKYTSQKDILTKVILFIGYFVYLGFLIWAWHKKGRDPTGRAIMPQYEPPTELTAAQAACLYNKGETGNLILISLVQMISNGFLKLTLKKGKRLLFPSTTYILEKTGKQPSNAEEKSFDVNKITLDGQYRRDIKSLTTEIKTKVEKSMKSFYSRNQAWVFKPTFVYILLWLFLCYYLQENPSEIMQFLFFSSFFMICCICLFFGVLFYQFKKSLKNLSLGRLIFLTILILVCFRPLNSIFSYNSIVSDISRTFSPYIFESILLLCVISTCAIFLYLLYQPTEKGQRLTEHLEGLKMFLKATKTPAKERLKIEEKLNPENMEKLFPYAMALGLEKEWENRYKWYFGVNKYNNFVHSHPYTSTSFARSLASSTSSSSGHSSGGSCGGGSAGGGGGGGGGGR